MRGRTSSIQIELTCEQRDDDTSLPENSRWLA